jgi:hemolysin activation/secretion protein
MPLALPPAIAPETADPATLSSQGDAIAVANVKGVHVHVLSRIAGADHDALARAVAAAPSLSEAVYEVRAWFYGHGHPGVRTFYAKSGEDLWVLATETRVVRVDMPEPWRDYFASVTEQPAPTDRAIERARTAASVQADRARVDAQLRWSVEPDGLVLGIEQGPPKRPPLSVSAAFGNAGNRYAGRWLGELGATLSLASGDEFTLSGRQAVHGIDDAKEPGSYDDQALLWSRVAPSGVWSLAGQRVRYEPRIETAGGDTVHVHGSLDRADAQWSTVVSAGFAHRVGASLQGSFVDQHASVTGTTIEDQQYGALGGEVEFLRGYQGLQWGGGLSVRQGLGKDHRDRPETGADLGFLVARPSLRLQVPGDEGWGAELALSGQITGDVLPEQEQWVGGGSGNVDAVLPGTLVGDRAAAARLRVDLGALALGGGFTLGPGAFADYARTWREEPAPDTSGRQALADAGLSLELRRDEGVQLSLAWAAPFADRGFAPGALHDARADVVVRLRLRFPT